MDITPRQKEFLSKAIDLYQLAGKPIHYTTIAEKLGISKWSAYDMMKLLEGKGLITSKYDVPGKGRGAGRSSVVFSPTSKGEALMHELSDGVIRQKEWYRVKEKILERLSQIKGTEYEGLLKKILKMMPKR